jgi:hypothetical protein
VPFYVISAVSLSVMIVALVLANLGMLLVLLLFELGLPASTFATVVDEYRPQGAIATDPDPADD